MNQTVAIIGTGRIGSALAVALFHKGFVTTGWNPVLETMFTRLHGTIQSKDYDETQASLDVWASCPGDLIKWCKKHGVDHGFVDPQLFLMEKAIKAGKGKADFRIYTKC